MKRRKFLFMLAAAPIAAAVALRPPRPVMGILRRGVMTFPINYLRVPGSWDVPSTTRLQETP